jgi:four helix bundle protein
MRNFRNIQVWKRAHELVLAVYRVTAEFPKGENYGLTSQMRRASVSIPANIAEGCGRSGNIELARYLEIARSSAGELEYYVVLARDLGLIKPEVHDQLSETVTEVEKMLASYRLKVREG